MWNLLFRINSYIIVFQFFFPPNFFQLFKLNVYRQLEPIGTSPTIDYAMLIEIVQALVRPLNELCVCIEPCARRGTVRIMQTPRNQKGHCNLKAIFLPCVIVFFSFCYSFIICCCSGDELFEMRDVQYFSIWIFFLFQRLHSNLCKEFNIHSIFNMKIILNRPDVCEVREVASIYHTIAPFILFFCL